MYSTKNIENIQNEKCDSCMFCVWNSERKQYVCDVKGCYENSKYIEFSWDKFKGQLEEFMISLIILIAFFLAIEIGLLAALLISFLNTNDILQDILTELKWK